MKRRLAVFFLLGLVLRSFPSRAVDLLSLPDEVQEGTFQHLSISQLAEFRRANRHFRDLIDNYCRLLVERSSIIEMIEDRLINSICQKKIEASFFDPEFRAKWIRELLEREGHFVTIPGSTFEMGKSVSSTSYDQPPGVGAHWVTVDPFSIQKTPVTQLLWFLVTGMTPSQLRNRDYCRDEHQFKLRIGKQQYEMCIFHPVTHVSWEMITAQFIPQLAALTGIEVRLPTEAEWERAALGRTGESSEFGFIEDPLQEDSWCQENSGGALHSVACKRANQWGLSDMLGLVYEWVGDFYGPYPEADRSSPILNPVGSREGKWRVLRGGSFRDKGARLSPTYRHSDTPQTMQGDIGFRLVRVN